MKYLFVLLAALLLAASAPAVFAQTDLPSLDLQAQEQRPTGANSEPIPIQPDDIETFWAHISWPGHENEPLHIAEVSWHWWVEEGGEAVSQPIEWHVEPSQVVYVSQWFPWNTVHTVGRPSTLINFQADIVFHDASGAPHGPLWSNIVTKHIVPEPSALMAFGLPAASMAGVLWRRRRK